MTVDISDLIQSYTFGKMEINQLGKEVANRLEANNLTKEFEIKMLADEFSSIIDEPQFDEAINLLYEFSFFSGYSVVGISDSF